jgi:hypothetical protein
MMRFAWKMLLHRKARFAFTVSNARATGVMAVSVDGQSARLLQPADPHFPCSAHLHRLRWRG